jgi:methyl-accepting chemotaxis protein
MFKNISIGVRLGIGFAIVVVLFAITLISVGVSLSHLTQDVRTINEKSLPYVMVADEMDLGRSEVQQFLTDVSATHDRGAYKEAEDSAKRFLNGVEKFKELYKRENDPYNLKQIEEIEVSFNKFYNSGKVMAEAYIINGIDAGNLLMKGNEKQTGFDQDSEAIASSLEKFRSQQVAEANKITSGALSSAKTTLFVMIWGGLAAALAAAIIGLWIVRAILRQLGGEPSYAADVVSRIAAGDLSVEVQTKTSDSSSMLFAIKGMVDKLTGIVGGVRSTTESITTAAQEVAAGNSDLSQRTEEQASSLEETASSMEELTSTVRQNAENAKQANQLAVNASDVAVKGGQAVGDVVQTMASISASSKKIVDIIAVIEGIAFQTNILALNAAVEAARAGEQGRGFAVVASEVRNLAQRSAAAAKEIKDLIGDSVDKVDIGAKQVDQAGATMEEIVNAVKRVTDIMSEIAAASNEQTAGIEQVNKAITQMDEVTQQNAALVEEASASAESMREQAKGLYQAVSVFKLSKTREGAKLTVAKTAIAPHAETSPATLRKQRRLVKSKEIKSGEWKEF